MEWSQVFREVEWTDEELNVLRAGAALHPMDKPDRFELIAQTIPGKNFVDVAKKMYLMNVDGFTCRCGTEVKHVRVMHGEYHEHGNLKFCSATCKEAHIADQDHVEPFAA